MKTSGSCARDQFLRRRKRLFFCCPLTLGDLTVTNSNIKTDACNAISNPAAAAAIGTTINTIFGAGTVGVGAIANAALGTILAEAVPKVLTPILNKVISIIPFDSILKFFVGDLTKNLTGESVGDALSSGAAQVTSQTSNAGGNMPLTVNQAVAFDNLTKQVQVAYAQEDRATLNPLDTSIM
jgi:hypothetical protein